MPKLNYESMGFNRLNNNNKYRTLNYIFSRTVKITTKSMTLVLRVQKYEIFGSITFIEIISFMVGRPF